MTQQVREVVTMKQSKFIFLKFLQMFKRFGQSSQYTQEERSRGKQKSENAPLILSAPQGAAPLPPSLTLSVSMKQDVLQKFAQMDRIMQDLQQLTC